MPYEYEGEYWLDPNIGKLVPRWVWPCADPENPDNEFILGHMTVKSGGSGDGKLIPRYQGSDILGAPEARAGITVRDCPGGDWTGYLKVVNGKLRPYLYFPSADSIADIPCDCGGYPGLYGDPCAICAGPPCTYDPPTCTLNWPSASEAPRYIGVEFSGIILCPGAVLPDSQVNTRYMLTQNTWWYNNDPGSYPQFLLDNQGAPTIACRWTYYDEVYDIFIYLHLGPTQNQMYMAFNRYAFSPGIRFFFVASPVSPACITPKNNSRVVCSGSTDGYDGTAVFTPYANVIW